MDHSQNAPQPGPPKPGPPTPVTDEGDALPSGDAAAMTAPETGDLVVDATLRDLAAVDASDPDATLAAGESVQATLTARLSDLGT